MEFVNYFKSIFSSFFAGGTCVDWNKAKKAIKSRVIDVMNTRLSSPYTEEGIRTKCTRRRP